MFWDEILVQREMEESHKSTGRSFDQIREEILKKEREQKAVSQYISELRSGFVSIGENQYLCEKKQMLQGKINVYIFTEDIGQLVEETSTVNISYRTLEMGATLAFVQAPLTVKDEADYQKQLKQKLDGAKIPYQPVGVGNFLSGNQIIRYVSGITTNIVGGLFTMNYYFVEKKNIVAGSFTCKLLERYTFEHLFLAMMQLLCEENKKDTAD